MNSSSQTKQLTEVCRVLGSLSDEISHWFNHGKFSIYDVIEYILSVTGKADLKITSFSVSEEAVRRFLYFMDDDLLSSAQFIFDHSTSRNKMSLMLFISKSFEVRLSNNHTKIILIKNDEFNIVISTSANLNQNTRHENGFVSTDERTYEIFERYFDKVFTNAIPYQCT